MKVVTLVKKNKLMVIVALIYLVIFLFSPVKALKSLANSGYYLKEMLEVLPVIFLLTVVIEAWVPKEMIMRSFGEKSGIKGNLLSLLLGSISAGPIYAAFPISKTLIGKGASITNIVIILNCWAVIKVPMLANEAKFLGVNFMVVRWILTVATIFMMAYLTAVIVKKADLPAEREEGSQDLLKIREEYCVGCGLCAKLMPEYYVMNGKKASVKATPEGASTLEAMLKVVQKCPTKAIVLRAC